MEIPVTMKSTALVITTIHAPADSMRQFAAESRRLGVRMIVVGDRGTPGDFHLPGCEYFDLRSQQRLDLRLASSCPVGSYARKNLGYLIALGGGAALIVESDDDNAPMAGFFGPRGRHVRSARVSGTGWTNVYAYYTDQTIWPRGFPLDAVHHHPPPYEQLPMEEADCPIQQGLVAGHPDVDAVFRLVFREAPRFRSAGPIAVGRGSWCPVNSQNTAWLRDAAPLLYLPAHCSSRMTDIWRGFVAQRIGWENGWSVLFHGASARQNRNEHYLMRDFEEELPGYLHSRRVAEILGSLSLAGGVSSIADNLRACYAALVQCGAVSAAELKLLEDWLADVPAPASQEPHAKS